MTASQRIAELNQTDAAQLCAMTDAALSKLVDLLNNETTLLREGHLKKAGELAPQKALAAQEYTVLARTVQREAARLSQQAPQQLERLHKRHESLATQMAENLRVLATAKTVTEDLLSDVASSVGAAQAPKTYGAAGHVAPGGPSAQGLSVNRAL